MEEICNSLKKSFINILTKTDDNNNFQTVLIIINILAFIIQQKKRKGIAMTQHDLDLFLDTHRHIEWKEDDDAILFRNALLPWYQNDLNRATRVTREKLQTLNGEDLLSHINWGLDVEHITRVTGYFAKTRSFNPGKLAEFKDRNRMGV